MTPEQKTELEWCAQQVATLSKAVENMRSRQVVAISSVLLRALDTHVAETFPEFNGTDESSMTKAGPPAWKALHRRALFTNVKNEAEERHWLEKDFNRMIPCPACRGFLQDYMKKNPPTFQKYFEWTVALHNAVNAKAVDAPGNTQKGKQYTVEEARAIWLASK